LGRKISWLYKETWKKWAFGLNLQQMANGSYMKPKASYVMTNEKNNVFLQAIKKLKTPTNYASTLRSKVQKDGKLRGLKP
jgi:hypothetical protein